MKKYILIILFTLFYSSLYSQVNPFFGGSVGYLNNVGVSMKAGIQVRRFNAEVGVSFSQVVPFQNSFKLGYTIGSKWYAIPYAGAAYYTYSNEDRSKNYTKPAVGIEIGKHINLKGKHSEYLLEGFDIYGEAFGQWIGLGFKVVL